jgi:FMN phosphatase YigB (HAD superfamily)
MKRNKLLICDLDNTLYDWVAFFVPAFYAMVAEAATILACDREELLDDLQSVHRKYHDAEHPFALLETSIVGTRLQNLELSERRRLLDPAFKAFNSTRKKNLTLYPGVREALSTLRDRGVRLVAHSESRVYGVLFRMKFLELTDYFERIYCIERPARTLAEESAAGTFVRDFPTERIVEIAHHRRKPNPEVLSEILRDAGIVEAEAAYVGDSIAKDVFMAKQTGCRAIWAEYGTKHDANLYKNLVRISPWTPDEIVREANLKELSKSISPDFIARKSFDEILTFLA